MKHIKRYNLFEAINIKPDIYKFIDNNDFDSFKEFVTDYDNFSRLDTKYNTWTPLTYCIFKFKTKFATLLIDAGADPDATTTEQITPLLQASYDNYMILIRKLIDVGADWFPVDKNNKTFFDNLDYNNKFYIKTEYPKQYDRYIKTLKTKKFNL
jgi:ankyrin repeat protein